ncbi:MAG: hypothetical protein AAGC93_10715 [Cyanobacteria bacterium P01_F01_bin.53]
MYPTIRYAIPRRIAAGTLAITSVLTTVLSAQLTSVAQTIPPDNVNQSCFAVADNGAPNGSTSGAEAQDLLVEINSVATNSVSAVGLISNNGIPVQNIEAMTSRADFDELIVANEAEIGRVDRDTAEFTSLGTLTSSTDFDAIVIERSGNEDRLLAVSKGTSPNLLVEVTLAIDTANNNQTTGIASEQILATLSNFPAGTTTIDGIALAPNGTLYGIANDGASSAQRLVIIDPATGVLTDLGAFVDGVGPIPDVEDISFDLGGNLFASSGSNRFRFQDNGFFVPLAADGTPQQVTDVITLGQDGGTDFEASSCLQTQDDVATAGDLIIVKRITAVTTNGQETRFNDFVDQTNESDDNRLRDLLSDRFPNGGDNFPAGIVQTPTNLTAGDQVEYTVYLYNPGSSTTTNAVLCDPIEPPSILDSSSVAFAAPGDGLNLNFANNEGFARAPLSAAPADCSGVLEGNDSDRQFPAGPPGPSGGLNVGAGGGIVTDSFDVGANQLSALRFSITVGQSNLVGSDAAGTP